MPELISIILPVYNEGQNIKLLIPDLVAKVALKKEILIIYDFDEDNSVPVVRQLQKKYGSKILRLVKNMFGEGIINAIRTGFLKSGGNLIVVMPADLADRPETIVKMKRKIDEGFDVVCATRYAKGGKKIGGGFIKTWLSRTAGFSTPLFLGIPTTDICNGFKMYRREVIKKVKIESSGGWEFAMEMVIKAHYLDFKISEVPTVWRDRILGKSKFKLMRWLPKYARWYLWGFYKRLDIDR